MRKLEQAVRRIPSSVGMVGAIVALIPWFPYPGRIVADTKIDLSLDPWGYLARSQSAWDSHAAFGQLQNQAYGYLFPMGPFFGVGRSLDIPEWVVQRAWWSVILLTAFVGMYRLCRRVGIAGRGGSVVAALAFALSPHALTVLGAISIEQWPSAMTPWLILVSLRLLESSGRDRLQATALLAVTCAAVGGVNATATLAAIGVSAIFVLTAGRRGLRVFPLWLVSVVAGTAWWTIPLVVLGVYAFPFLDFIETTTITTAVTSVPNVLRGASHWVPYTGGDWPAGAHLAAAPVAVMATTSVAVCGILGLALRRRWPEDSHARIFAIVSLLTGLTAMGLAYGAQLDLPFTSPFATDARKALDGSLSAFRNVHKFDAMVRLPVSLGLAVTAAAVGRRARDSRSVAVQGVRKYASAAALVGLVLALSVAIAPAVGTSLAPRAPFDAVPQRWYSAADKIDQMAASQGGATLVAPASRFGEYTWGSTRDDPLAALADSPVVERDAIPLGNPGAIRVMDTLDAVLQRGGQQPGLIDVLDRLGIARVVVPHDALQHLSDPETEPGVVGDDSLTESTLMASGLHLVKSWGSGRKRLAIWSTGRSVDAAVAYDARSVVGITGGPEAIISLAAFGEAGEGSPAYVIAPSPRAFEPVLWVQTDSLRRRDLDVAATTSHAYSATLQPGDKLQRRDFPPAGAAAPTTRGFVGLRKVTSSSTSSASLRTTWPPHLTTTMRPPGRAPSTTSGPRSVRPWRGPPAWRLSRCSSTRADKQDRYARSSWTLTGQRCGSRCVNKALSCPFPLIAVSTPFASGSCRPSPSPGTQLESSTSVSRVSTRLQYWICRMYEPPRKQGLWWWHATSGQPIVRRDEGMTGGFWLAASMWGVLSRSRMSRYEPGRRRRSNDCLTDGR